MGTLICAHSGFGSEELSTLRNHGIALFADRVIFDAQPPMAEADIAAVQAVCSGPIPQQLLDLWRCTAGGSLDYGLTTEMRGNREAISWCELFFNGSERYHDLQGWIEHELQLAEGACEERGIPWSGKLDALPFGGFEYTDRIYTIVEPGSTHGAILAWKQGLPPAWTHQLHADSIATIGVDLHSAFGALHLPEDPLDPTEEFFAGETFLQFVSERVAEHGLDQSLADKLIAFYRRAIVDWRSKLSDGTLTGHHELASLALEHAIRTNDGALIRQLHSARVQLNAPLRGSARPIEMAISLSAYQATEALIDSGAQVTPRCLSDIQGTVPASLVKLLLAHGAEPAVDAVIACVEFGSTESAQVIAAACAARDAGFRRVFDEARRERVRNIEEDLSKMRTGKMGHYLSEDELSQHVERLQGFQPPSAGQRAWLRWRPKQK